MPGPGAHPKSWGPARSDLNRRTFEINEQKNWEMKSHLNETEVPHVSSGECEEGDEEAEGDVRPD